MAEGSDQPQPPERDSAEKIRAELRAAGLLKYLETPPAPPPGTRPQKRREATILPFVAPTSRAAPAKPAPEPKRRIGFAAIAYLLIALAILAMTFL